MPAWWRGSRRSWHRSWRPCSAKCACGSALPGCRAGRSRTVSAPSSDGRQHEELIGGLAVGAARRVAVLCSIFVAAPAMGELAVHVNRVALEADGPKSALVESDKAGATGGFTVLRDGKTVLVAPLVPQPDLAEWGASKHYYLPDFSQLNEPGRYHVRARVGEGHRQSTQTGVACHYMFE